MNFRSTLCLFFIFSSLSFLNAQPPFPSDTATLHVNNLKIRLLNSGTFFNFNREKVAFSLKTKNEEIPLAIAAGLWFGGRDETYWPRTAAGLYSDLPKTDFYPGPLNAEGALDSTASENFNQFWSITSEDIGLLVADYADNQAIDNEIPYALRAWPAKGNSFFENTNGFPLPQSMIGAPFYDRNEDNIYNPLDGDYPCLAGDESYWWIFNDAGSHSYSGSGNPLDIEVQAIATAVKSQGSVLNNTIFFDFTFRNRGLEHIDSLFISFVTDIGFGDMASNRIASLPEEDIALFYNAPPYYNSCDSTGGQENLGVLAIKTIHPPAAVDELVLPMSSFMFYTQQHEESITGPFAPQYPSQYYNYMNAIWADNSPLFQGGDGFNESNTAITKYAFDVSVNTPWYDSLLNSHVPILTHRTFRYQQDKINRIIYAVSWIEGEFDVTSAEDKQRIVDSMNQTLIYFMDDETQLYPSRCHYELPENLISPTLPSDVLLISPNPAVDKINIKLKNSLHKIDELQLFDIQGRKVSHWKTIDARTFIVPRNGLPTGMYVLAIKLTNGEEEIRKVIFE